MPANTRVAIATNPVARPSSPSVRFTELDVAVITRIIRGIYNHPRSKTPFATKGIEIEFVSFKSLIYLLSSFINLFFIMNSFKRAFL